MTTEIHSHPVTMPASGPTCRCAYDRGTSDGRTDAAAGEHNGRWGARESIAVQGLDLDDRERDEYVAGYVAQGE